MEDFGIIVNKYVKMSGLKGKLSTFCHSHNLLRCDYVFVDSMMHSQDPPSGTRELLPQIPEVLPTENPQLSAPYQDCFS